MLMLVSNYSCLSPFLAIYEMRWITGFELTRGHTPADSPLQWLAAGPLLPSSAAVGRSPKLTTPNAAEWMCWWVVFYVNRLLRSRFLPVTKRWLVGKTELMNGNGPSKIGDTDERNPQRHASPTRLGSEWATARWGYRWRLACLSQRWSLRWSNRSAAWRHRTRPSLRAH